MVPMAAVLMVTALMATALGNGSHNTNMGHRQVHGKGVQGMGNHHHPCHINLDKCIPTKDLGQEVLVLKPLPAEGGPI